MIWLNGSLQPLETAAISPFDHGLTVGDGVFETLIAEAGMPFAFTRHYERLVRSAGAMGLTVRPVEELREGCVALLQANALEDQPARVRITVTGGPAPLGSERGSASETVVIAATPVAGFGETADVVVVPYTRNERGALVGLKTTSYGENVVALAYAKERGGGEAIFGNTRGELCEGTGSNVFLVHEGALVTPPLESGCLAGVTRALVIELCGTLGVPLREESVPLSALSESPEAFLTSTTRDVQPIGEVDGVVLERAPGEITATLRKEFLDWARREIDP